MRAPSDKEPPVKDRTGRASVTTASAREIVITRAFEAPRTVVFEAWTKAEHVAHWWDPSGAPLAVCEIDLRPTGAFRFVHGGQDGATYTFAGVYREIVAPARLVFTTRNAPSGAESVGTLVFNEHAGKTTLTMTIEWQSMADRDAMLKMGVAVGITRTLDNLDAYLGTIG
jgi:uncharacterized protein YndB with AHSA1/START domain